MKKNVVIQITVPNQTRYLSLVGSIGENMVHGLDTISCNKDTLGHHINTVLTEALVNAIKHANVTLPNTEVQIDITVSDNELMIQVYDNGEGFDLEHVSDTACPDPLNEQGRGIFIIKSLMDSVVYKKVDDKNVLEMKKILT